MIEHRLAHHVSTLSAQALSAAATDAFDRLIADFFAVTLAGFGDCDARKIGLTFASLSGEAQSSVLGSISLVPAPSAAFAHGAMAHWFDWDDTHDSSHIHGGAVILPSAIALYEAAAAAGNMPDPTEFVASVVAGYDVACRLGAFLRPHSHRGWMPTGGATIGAAAAGARLMGLDQDGILSAMGIAAANAGLSRQALADKVNGKGILAAIAAKSATEAVLLAARGIHGAPTFLTGMYGLQALHASGAGQADEIADSLGERFSLTEVSIKPYPCCRSTHAVLDIIMGMRERLLASHEEIERIEITVPPGCHERCGKPFDLGSNPRLSAQFSLAYVTALMLRHGAVTLADFESTTVVRNQAQFGDLIRIISSNPDRSIKDDVLAPASVRIVTRRGTFEGHVEHVRGAPDSQMGPQEVYQKLHTACSGMKNDLRTQLESSLKNLQQDGPGITMNILRDKTYNLLQIHKNDINT